jgi:hypothetical protein
MASSAGDDNDWYDDACLAEGRYRDRGKRISSRPGPITVRIRWKVSGNVWFEKGMVEPTQSLSSILSYRHPASSTWMVDRNGMRLYIAATDVQVFYDQTPLEIWRSGNEEGEFSILHLECVRVSGSD